MRSFILSLSVMAIFAFGAPSIASATGCGPMPWQTPCQPEPEPEAGGNVNTNTNTANGGDAEVGNGFGNFSPSATAFGAQGQGQFGINEQDQGQEQGQDQGQEQGQGQGQGQSQEGFNAQGQGQGQVGINKATGSGNETTYTDNSVYEAQKRNPVASAAPVFATACSRGASGQGVGFGGAIAFTNELCDLALAAEMAARSGDLELRDKLIGRAGELAFARGNKLRVWLQWVPIVGQFL